MAGLTLGTHCSGDTNVQLANVATPISAALAVICLLWPLYMLQRFRGIFVILPQCFAFVASSGRKIKARSPF